MDSIAKKLSLLIVFVLVINVSAIILHTSYVTYQRYEDARDIEILKFLPAGADKVNYHSEAILPASVYQIVDMQERAYKRRGNEDERLLYEFMKWATRDLKALGVGFYENDDLYILKHKKKVEEFQFKSNKIKKSETYDGIGIYKMEIRRGNAYGIIYFAYKGKYIVHSSSMELLKKSLDLINGKDDETAYDEFEHLIKRVPISFWKSLALVHVKDPNAKIPYLAGGLTHDITYFEKLKYIMVIKSDPRGLHGGFIGGLGFYPSLYYVVLQCKDETCIKEYSDILYKQKCFDLKIKDNYIHAKKFIWDPQKEYNYIRSGMFPYSEAYLDLFLFFGYEWRGKDVGKQYYIQSPEFPSKVEIKYPVFE